jgi:hypothetical protein
MHGTTVATNTEIIQFRAPLMHQFPRSNVIYSPDRRSAEHGKQLSARPVGLQFVCRVHVHGRR